MPRFIAIPVAQGDAFYLERSGFSTLVDGGRSRFAFPTMFRDVTQSDGVDILICTHNDADHANGILGFLEAGLRCNEVWLPGRWLSALPDVLRPFVEVLVNLSDSIVEIRDPTGTERPDGDRSPVEAYAERLGDGLEESCESDSGPSVGEDGWPASYVQMLEQAEPWEVPFGAYLNWPFLLYNMHGMLGPSQLQLLWSAIDAAHRIRTIAIEAFHRGIPVRWFEFDAAKPSGGVESLNPINARVIAKVRPRVHPLLRLLALTVSNKESLVFWSPPTDQHPGVLFTADSDLAGASLPSNLHGALATAPHHGSEANAGAYAVVKAAAPQDYPSVTWIRSDGRYKNRPGNAYLGLASRRLCTLCRHGTGKAAPKQVVHLFSRGAMWIRHRVTLPCTCV